MTPAAKRLIDDNSIISPSRFVDGHPHDIWRILRSYAPVYHCEPTGYRPFWAITKYDDIVEIEKRVDIFLNEPRFMIMPTTLEDYMIDKFGSINGLFKMMAQMDAPEHAVYRKILMPWFSPKSITVREGEIRAMCGRFFDRLGRNGPVGEVDIANDLAFWFPLRTICAMMGLSQEDDHVVLKMTEQLFNFDTPSSGSDESGFEVMVNYFKGIIEDRRVNPCDDISTYLVQARLDGNPLHERELLAYFIILGTAGHDTTASAITGGVKALIEHPEQLQALRADRSQVRDAVEEILRWVTPTIHFSRTAAQDYELRGQLIRKGDTVVLYFSSGNRDEDVFPEPDRFNIKRRPNRHLAFGSGPHACLGLHLARLEIRVFIETLLDRVEELEIVGPTPSIAANLVTRLAQLPVRYRLKPEYVRTPLGQ